jgi:hypothetical protein
MRSFSDLSATIAGPYSIRRGALCASIPHRLHWLCARLGTQYFVSSEWPAVRRNAVLDQPHVSGSRWNCQRPRWRMETLVAASPSLSWDPSCSLSSRSFYDGDSERPGGLSVVPAV